MTKLQQKLNNINNEFKNDIKRLLQVKYPNINMNPNINIDSFIQQYYKPYNIDQNKLSTIQDIKIQLRETNINLTSQKNTLVQLFQDTYSSSLSLPTAIDFDSKYNNSILPITPEFHKFHVDLKLLFKRKHVNKELFDNNQFTIAIFTATKNGEFKYVKTTEKQELLISSIEHGKKNANDEISIHFNKMKIDDFDVKNIDRIRFMITLIKQDELKNNITDTYNITMEDIHKAKITTNKKHTTSFHEIKLNSKVDNKVDNNTTNHFNIPYILAIHIQIIPPF